MEKSFKNIKIQSLIYKIIFILLVFYFKPKNTNLSDSLSNILTNRVIIIYIYLTLIYEFKGIILYYKNENIMIRTLSKKNFLKFCLNTYNKYIIKNIIFYISSAIITSISISSFNENIYTILYMLFYTFRYLLVLVTILDITILLLNLHNVLAIIYVAFNCIMIFYFTLPYDFTISKIGIKEIMYFNFFNSTQYSSILFEIIISIFIIYVLYLVNELLQEIIIKKESMVLK